MEEIEFVDEPPGARGPAFDWSEIVEKMAANEGQWAKVRHFPTPQAASNAAVLAREGRSAAFRRHRWEAKSRKANDGGGDLYLRCLGPVQS